jgi:hypothetical protein
LSGLRPAEKTKPKGHRKMKAPMIARHIEELRNISNYHLEIFQRQDMLALWEIAFQIAALREEIAKANETEAGR